MSRLQFVHNGSLYTLDLQAQGAGRWHVRVNDEAVELTAVPMADGGWRLHLPEKTVTVYVETSGTQHYVWVDGRHYVLETAAQPGSRSSRTVAGGSGRLTAQMPGQVRDVLVKPGDHVERGQTLMLLEAMKMELRVTAPGDGVVEKIYVEIGAVVERQAPLIELTLAAG